MVRCTPNSGPSHLQSPIPWRDGADSVSADLIEAAGRTFLLIEATAVLMGFLEGFGAARADMRAAATGRAGPDCAAVATH